MKKELLVIFTITLLLGCDNSTSNYNPVVKEKTEEELKTELQQKEKEKPLEYISIDASMNKNLVKEETWLSNAEYDGWIISGYITNKATLAQFKDIELQIEYYSKTNTVLNSEVQIIYEFSEPNSSIPFSIKVYPPDEFEKYNIVVINAK